MRGVMARLRHARAALAAWVVNLTRPRAFTHHEHAALQDAVTAQRRAEASSEAKSRFLASVSHEVRTPLAGILGMTDLLLASHPLLPEQISHLQAIQSSGRALASLIDDILDYARIEAGRLDIDHESFDLHGLVEGVGELLAPRAHGAGLELSVSITARTPTRVTGPAARLRQVLLNLAGNAIKFTTHGGVAIEVDAPAHGGVMFRVLDTGPGVPPHMATRIFEEFEQGDAAAAHGGAGLGLAISRRLVAAMGGALTLENPPEGGAAFCFDAALGIDPAAPARLVATPLEARRVLVVAATVFEGRHLAARLEEAGAQVTRAHDAMSAMTLLQASPTTPFDAALVDFALGAEAARCLSHAARLHGVARRIILFSPYERREQDGAGRDFDRWLVKPVRTRSLLAQFDDARGHGAQTSPPPPRAQARAMRVLLAEDNEINAIVATRHLERLGAQVVRAHDGAEAVAAYTIAAQAEPFDAVFLDIRMPGLDGLAAARAIQARHAPGRTPARLIALTANAFEHDRQACAAAGFDAFVAKPFDLDTLAGALQRIAPDQREQGAAA